MDVRNCIRCGQELQLVDHWPYPNEVTVNKGKLCSNCICSMPEAEENHW